ncbi:MAG: polysaccharide biosynthesis protein [Clostridia bacterium]|nr:polysaccharide biosynthesis protein [Clostridia bacterium]
MKKSLFIKNTLILTITALILRFIGMVFRVYMSNKIGAEGMGLYQLIFSVYILAATFATSGVSTAVTRLITDEMVCGTKKSVLHILHRAMLITVIIGTVINLAVYFFAPFIGNVFIKDARCIPALKILSFSLNFMGISSCLKGYFMARRKVLSPSSAQIFEQLVRISVVMLMLSGFAHKGVEYCCFAVLFGDTVAEAMSCGYMYIGYLIDKRKLRVENSAAVRPIKGVVKSILAIAVPISAGRYLNSLLRTVENLLVPTSLTSFNGSRELSLEQFGMLKGMAMPIIFFPSSFLMSMSSLLIPEISEANVLNQNEKIKKSVCRAIRITLMLSILLSALFTVLANKLGTLIYNSKDVGVLIKILAPLVPFMYLESVVDGMLKGLNQQNYSLLHSAIDSALRIVLIVALVPKSGIFGFMFVMVISNVFTSFLNLLRLIKVTKIRFLAFEWIIKPLTASVSAAALSYLFLNLLGDFGIIYLVLYIIITTVLYFAVMYLIKGITDKDLQFILPKNKMQKAD